MSFKNVKASNGDILSIFKFLIDFKRSLTYLGVELSSEFATSSAISVSFM